MPEQPDTGQPKEIAMTDRPTKDHQSGIEPAPDSFEASGRPAADRRKVLKLMGAASAGVAAPGFGATYLRGFEYTHSVQAEGSSPVKVGFIEDESGNLSVYGIQKLHAAQLAVKEINEGKTLKGGPDIGAGGNVGTSLKRFALVNLFDRKLCGMKLLNSIDREVSRLVLDEADLHR